VRAGRDLTPKSWPQGARVAVSLSFDLDTETVWLGIQEQSSPSYMSRGEYGARVGIFRVLDVLDRFGLTPSVALGAAAAKRYRTDAVKQVEAMQTTSGSGGSPR